MKNTIKKETLKNIAKSFVFAFLGIIVMQAAFMLYSVQSDNTNVSKDVVVKTSVGIVLD